MDRCTNPRCDSFSCAKHDQEVGFDQQWRTAIEAGMKTAERLKQLGIKCPEYIAMATAQDTLRHYTAALAAREAQQP